VRTAKVAPFANRHQKEMMMSKGRYLVLAFAFAVALAVGGIASANHTSNVSSLPEFRFTPSDAPKNTRVKGQLVVRTHTNYAHPGDKARGGFARKVALHFDNDLAVNLKGIPRCTATFGSGTTIRQAWERCGPGADTRPEVNAYLSPGRVVSGRASTAPPSNFNACTLVFKRGVNPGRILLYARVTLVANGTADCSNPANNTAGNTSVTLVGTLSNSGIADFGRKFTVPNIDHLPLPLDDFKARVKRGGFIKARCFDGNKKWNLRGRFEYSGRGQRADTVNRTQTCR
jgi:hypothetical protein